MENDWQTWTALAVVTVTIFLFAWRSRKKKGGCGSCGPSGCDSNYWYCCEHEQRHSFSPTAFQTASPLV